MNKPTHQSPDERRAMADALVTSFIGSIIGEAAPPKHQPGLLSSMLFSGGGVELILNHSSGAQEVIASYTVHCTHDEKSIGEARRLAAAWNACDGVSTEMLEQQLSSSGPMLMNKMQKCDALRDHLRATANERNFHKSNCTTLEANLTAAERANTDLHHRLRAAEGIVATRISGVSDARLAACLDVCSGISDADLKAVGVAHYAKINAELLSAQTTLAATERLLRSASTERDSLAAQFDAANVLIAHYRDSRQKEEDRVDGIIGDLHAQIAVLWADKATDKSYIANLTDTLGSVRFQLAEAHAMISSTEAAHVTHLLAELADARTTIALQTEEAADLAAAYNRTRSDLSVTRAMLGMRGAEPNTLATIQAQADSLIAMATAARVVLTVTQEPLLPLAMGNYRTVAAVRPMRDRAQ